jgi:N-hydroxyarylamine O-acetyltransferase
MDLDAYFARIGHDGTRRPDLVTLAAIIGHHAETIPFEAIDVLLGKGIDIAPEAIFDKLVHRKRGGYCFEQNGLLQAALTTLGFDVTARLARVLWMRPADAPPLRATHMALIVHIDGRDYLADAGFGNGTPTVPLAFDTAEPQATPLETFRLCPTSDGHVLEMRVGENWSPVYEILAGSPGAADFADANLFTSTSPESRFRRDLMLARATTEARFLLLGNRLMIRPAQGGAQVRSLNGPEALAETMETVFHLETRREWQPILARFSSPADVSSE